MTRGRNDIEREKQKYYEKKPVTIPYMFQIRSMFTEVWNIIS
jgi:hypothetical protein